jgi:uncharacterized protein
MSLTMKTPAAFAALAVALATAAAPATARDSYVIDGAHMLSSAAIAQIDSQVSAFNAQTGKEVLVVTTPSLNGASPEAAITQSFEQNAVNGVEIFIAKNERVIRIAGDRASSQFFPGNAYQSIAMSMRASFRAGDFDAGVENAVSIIINTYRGHLSSLNRARRPATVGTGYVRHTSSGGFHLGWIVWLIVLLVIFFIIRGIFRALSGPRYYGGGPGPGPGYGGPGYGGPGYGGPGYGGYGYGGGGFWSGLLGGLGGAWLGNELFGGNRTTIIDNNPGGFAGGGDVTGGGGDAAGWQNDAGQIDSSNIGGASWGDSGGGGWGGGDSGGGGGWGGGDSGGGGGGDSGGGW